MGSQTSGRVMFFVHDLRASGVVRNTLAIASKVADGHDVLQWFYARRLAAN